MEWEKDYREFLVHGQNCSKGFLKDLSLALSQGFLNIYLNDLFYFTESTEIYNFADDTRLFACDLNSLPVI